MRFLALTGLQASLLAALVAGAIVALYFLKLRHRRTVVASSLLWVKVLDERLAKSLWEKLRRLISILLAVTIGLLVALGLGRPEVSSIAGGGERVLLVLDTSPTMLTLRKDGRTRWQRAVDSALRLVRSSAPSSEFRVADTSGRVDMGFTPDRREIQEALHKMEPRPARESFPEPDPETTQARFITDGVVPMKPPKGTVVESVFEEAENVGITGFEIRSTASSSAPYQAWIEVRNLGKETRPVVLSIADSSADRPPNSITRELNLDPGERFNEMFDVSVFQGGQVRATVQSDADAFTADDEAYAYLPVKRKMKTLLVTTGSPYLEALLKLDSLVDVTTIKPSEFQPDPSFDAYVLDDFAPLNPPPRPALILGGTLDVGWLPKSSGTIASPRFESWNDEHPAMRFVSLHDVLPGRASRLVADSVDPQMVLAQTADGVPLILASHDPDKSRWVWLTFGLKGSDFPLHASFPLFIDNVLAWLGREPPALRRQPGLVTVPMANGEIRAYDGTVVPSYGGGEDQTVFEATQPGIYSVSGVGGRQHVAVSLADARYSDINRTSVKGSDRSLSAAGWLQQELWYYMLGAALLLAAAEWWTYHRGMTL